jgi:hypothetical protein
VIAAAKLVHIAGTAQTVSSSAVVLIVWPFLKRSKLHITKTPLRCETSME